MAGNNVGGNNVENRRSVPCRYYMNGGCRDGLGCRFSHDDRSFGNGSSSGGGGGSAMFCKYFQRGRCTYGDFCRYEHARPVRNSSNSNNGRGSGSTTTNTNFGDSGSGGTTTNERRQRRTPSSSASAAAAASSHHHSSTNNKAGENASTKSTDLLLKKTKLRPDAKEFIPAAAAAFFGGGGENSGDSSSSAMIGDDAAAVTTEETPSDLLCPYHILGQCWYGDNCSFTHGDTCDLCDRPVLNPNDEEANRKHRKECLAEHERDMQAAFEIARTKEKQCGICMEVVVEKTNAGARRFGILPNCKHCFCLDCIRKWRQAKQFENKIIRACPECRTVSDFVAPSSTWVDDEEEKRALIESYKRAMKEKPCKYFGEGKSECPFGNKCFYRHVNADGTEAEPDNSPRTIRRRQLQRQRREERQQQQRNRQNGVGGGGTGTGGGGTGTGGGGGGGGRPEDLYLLWDFLEFEDEWHRNRLASADDWPWEFQLDEEIDWLNLSDSESDYYDY